MTIALDVGATKTLIGVVRSGRVRQLQRYNTAKFFLPGGDIQPLVSVVKSFWKPNVSAIAVGFAGPVHNGVVATDVNFPAGLIPQQFPLAEKLHRAYNVPVVVLNDAQSFTLGEAIYGAGKHCQRIVGVTLGTGVGGGIVIDGELYRGEHQIAGEFGRLPFPAASGACGCGQTGHLETILSGRGLARLYATASGRAVTSEAVVRAARRGDRAANASLLAVEDSLIHLLLTVLVAWDPGIVIVGGGFAEVPRLLVRARRRVRNLVPYQTLRRVPIVPSLLHDHAILLGAAHFAHLARVAPVVQTLSLRRSIKLRERLRRLRRSRS